MAAQFNHVEWDRAVKALSFKSAKEWAKARKLDSSIGAEMINSLYRSEMQAMERKMSEQVEALLEIGDTQAITTVMAKAKGPILKIVAYKIVDSRYPSILDILLAKFQAADYSGRVAILTACQRAGGFAHLQPLAQIESTLLKRKKPGKPEQELVRHTASAIRQIIDQDAILKALKSGTPSWEAVKDFSAPELHSRLMQLPFGEMLSWLQVIQGDSGFIASSQVYALDCLAPSKQVKKPKPSKSDVRYCTTLLVLMGSPGNDKLLVNSFCKLDPDEQLQLWDYLNDKTRGEVLKKLLGSPATLEAGISMLEQNKNLVPQFRDRLLKCFEESKITVKIRLGLLLLSTGILPENRKPEYLRRLSTYAELADQSSARTSLVRVLFGENSVHLTPTLHRFNKREALYLDLEQLYPDILPLVLQISLESFRPTVDQAGDLVWLIEKSMKLDWQPAFTAVLGDALSGALEVERNAMGLFAQVKPGKPEYRRLLGHVIANVLLKSGSEKEFMESGSSALISRFAPVLLDDWMERWYQLGTLQECLTRLSMADYDFKQSYGGAFDQSWAQCQTEYQLQLQRKANGFEQAGQALKSQLDSYIIEVSNQINEALAGLGKIVEGLNLPNKPDVFSYVEECRNKTRESIAPLAAQLEEVVQPPLLLLEKPTEYRSSFENLIIRRGQLDNYREVENWVGFKVAQGLCLTLEGLFLSIRRSPQADIQAVETGVAGLIHAFNANFIASTGDLTSFDPACHRSNQDLNTGDSVRVVFPGIKMQEGTIVRHAMVERAV